MEKEFLILVDDRDKPWGKLEKELVHEKGILHRAFSVFIFNSKGEMLLQQRAENKYHSRGLWTNACCSHPRWGEDTIDAVNRRLFEEMGIKCRTKFQFTFIYKTQLDNGLIEHELDHVYTAIYNTHPLPDPHEVKDWRYIPIEELKNEIITKPETFTFWFRQIAERVIATQKIQKREIIAP